MSWRAEFTRAGDRLPVQAERAGDGEFTVRVGDQVYRLSAARTPEGDVRMLWQGRWLLAASVLDSKSAHVRLDGHTWRLTRHRRNRQGAAAGGDGRVRAPMTGTVLKVLTSVGEQVTADQTLAVLTAMKMEHNLTAGIAGKVVAVEVAEGAAVEEGALLIAVEAPDERP